MKKFFLLLLLLFFLPPAQASAAVPSFQETAPYKRLSGYVERLEEVGRATNEQKAIYRSELTVRVQAAEEKVASLARQRKSQVEKKYNNVWKRQKVEVERRAQSRIRSARKETERTIGSSRREFLQARSAVRARYRDRLAPFQKRISRLQRKVRASKDPRQKALFLDEINLLQRELQKINAEISRETERARRAFLAERKRARQTLRSKEAVVRRQERAELQESRRSWKREQTTALESLQARRGRENGIVRALQNRGFSAIAAMRS